MLMCTRIWFDMRGIKQHPFVGVSRKMEEPVLPFNWQIFHAYMDLLSAHNILFLGKRRLVYVAV